MRKNFKPQEYHSYRLNRAEMVIAILKTVGMVCAFSYFYYKSLWAILPLSVIGVFLWQKEKKQRVRLQKEKFTEQFNECLLSVVASLQAGYSVENAFLESREDMANLYGQDSMIFQELEYIRRGLVINIALEELLGELAKRRDSEDVEQFAQIFGIAKNKGGNLPEIIHRTSDLFHQRYEAKQEIMTMLSGKEMEQKIMKAMPFLFLLYLGYSYPGYFDSLYHNITGICVMTLCLGLYIAADFLGEVILTRIREEIVGVGAKKKSTFLKSDTEEEKVHGFVRLMRKLEKCFYTKVLKKGNSFVCSERVSQDLKRLYPGENRDLLREEYYLKKMNTMVLLLTGGSIFILLMKVQSYREGGEDQSLIFGVILIAVTVAMYFLKDKDLHDQVIKQRMSWKLQYPDMVHKMVLYLGAGLSIRKSFGLLSADYEMAVYVCSDLGAGRTETMAYDRFGKRTGLQEYMRFSTLLIQNLKKGNASLLGRLEEEAYKSSKERIQIARRMGEEAETKLLVPMVLLLASVMIMIMVPAFYGMEL